MIMLANSLVDGFIQSNMIGRGIVCVQLILSVAMVAVIIGKWRELDFVASATRRFLHDFSSGLEVLEYYLNLTNDQLRPNTGRYARISSTTREMYYAAGGQADVGYSDDGRRSQAWLGEVGRLYREAWNSDKNFLIYAWAKANL